MLGRLAVFVVPGITGIDIWRLLSGMAFRHEWEKMPRPVDLQPNESPVACVAGVSSLGKAGGRFLRKKDTRY